MSRNLIELQREFVNDRLGMFIHFNSATVQFCDSTVEDWEFDCENKGEPRRYPFNPKLWNPSRLDCRQWAQAAKSLGAEFAALTAKHHEGFCLWPTETTEHCVRNASVTTDVVQAYLNAFRAEGIKAGLYFSILDLTQGIGKRRCNGEDRAFLKAQIRELLTNYDEIPFLIVDGWASPWGGPSYADLPFEEVDGLVKKLQPECLLLNIGSLDGLAHSDIVFHETSAGQEIEDSFAGPGASCHKLTEYWFWNTGDPAAELKPARWALDWIERSNRRNTTFILNSTPNPDGLLDDNLLARFREIGQAYQKPAPLEELPANWLQREILC